MLPAHTNTTDDPGTLDAEGLDAFDHPTHSFIRWKAILTGKATLNGNLACFFVGHADMRKLVLVFRQLNEFKPRYGGHDMREAVAGSIYDLDVLVARAALPIVERAERVIEFP